MQKILVAVDGSDNGFRALMRAKKIGSAFKCKITILHVVEDHVNPTLFSVDNISGYDVLLQKELERESAKLLDSYMEHFKDYEGEVETITENGNPANEIIKLAEKGEYCLIVIGSRGLGPFTGAMLGSVTNRVVNKSKVDVLTVK